MEYRVGALRLLVRRLPLPRWQVWDLEQCVYDAHNDSDDYRATISRMCHNLEKAPWLATQYALPELVLLSNAALAANTDVEAWTRIHKDTQAQRQRLLFTEHRSGSGGLLVCKRCHGNNIDVKQQQTRGADESMTVFCSCDRCGLRWKM